MDVSSEDWDTMMNVNAKGVFLGVKHAIPAMRRAGGGSIVQHILDRRAYWAGPWLLPRTARPKERCGYLQSQPRGRFAAEGIRCNSIHPGPIDTDMIRAATNSVRPETRVGEIPIGRLGQPEDVAYGAPLPSLGRSIFRNRLRVGDRWRSVEHQAIKYTSVP